MTKLKHEFLPCIKINVPDWFADAEFQKWLAEAVNMPGDLATWHVSSEPPGDSSDIFMTYDYTDGSNSDMPERFWDQLCETLGSGWYVVWLTNLDN